MHDPRTLLLCHLKSDHSWLGVSAVAILGWARRFSVKASKLTNAQKAFVIKRDEDEAPVAEFSRKTGNSQATYINYQLINLRDCHRLWLRQAHLP